MSHLRSPPETRHDLLLAAALAVLAIACTGAWIVAGTPVPGGRATPSLTPPFVLLLSYVAALGSGATSLALAWSITLPAMAAAALALLLVARVGRAPHAQRLALSLAAMSCGFATLFIVPNLFLGDAPPSAAAIAARLAVDCAAVALMGWGSWLLVRFWTVYPTKVDPAAVADFAARRAASVAPFAVRLLRRRLPARGDRWIPFLGIDGFTASPVGRYILAWSAAACVVWSLVSLAGLAWPHALARRNALVVLYLAVLGLVPVIQVVFAPAYRVVGTLVGYHYAAGTDLARRISWLRIATEWSRFLLGNPLVPLGGWVILFLLEDASSNERGFAQLTSICLIFPMVVAPTLLIAGLGASILADGLVDPRLALRRVTLWTLLGFVITLVFVLVERFVALQVARWMALPDETGAVVAGTIVALTFVPIRRVAEKWVNNFVEMRMPTHLLASGDKREGAVAVVDISGFTALSARDEPSALLATALVQKEARRLADAHAGQVVKFTGDGALLVFERAADAAIAVAALHATFERDAVVLGLPPLKLHSGMSWGEFVDVRGIDVYGHTVNVASRVADSAAAGEVLVTAAFAEALGPHAPPLVPVGARRFRNVPDAIECLRLPGP